VRVSNGRSKLQPLLSRTGLKQSPCGAGSVSVPVSLSWTESQHPHPNLSLDTERPEISSGWITIDDGGHRKPWGLGADGLRMSSLLYLRISIYPTGGKHHTAAGESRQQAHPAMS